MSLHRGLLICLNQVTMTDKTDGEKDFDMLMLRSLNSDGAWDPFNFHFVHSHFS